MFATNASRVENRDTTVARIRDIVMQHPSAHWLEGLERLKIGCGPINTMDQVFTDPHVLAREMVRKIPHPAAGPDGLSIIGSPLRLSETPVEYRHHPPLLGEHTEEVLRDTLGMDDTGISALRDCGAI